MKGGENVIASVRVDKKVLDLYFAGDGQYLIARLADGEVVVWKRVGRWWKEGAEVRELWRGQGPVGEKGHIFAEDEVVEVFARPDKPLNPPARGKDLILKLNLDELEDQAAKKR